MTDNASGDADAAAPVVVDEARSAEDLIDQIDELRKTGQDGVRILIRDIELENPDFSGASFIECDFENCTLKFAVFKGATLSGVNFRNITLSQADFSNAQLTSANFDSQCGLFDAKFVGANMSNANINATVLEQADFTGADLQDADFDGAELKNAKFTRADLRRVENFNPDQTFVRGAIFSADAPDDWSTLRRNYTGLKLTLNLAALGLFLGILTGKAFGLYGVALIQASAIDGFVAALANADTYHAAVEEYCMGEGASCRKTRIWAVLLGLTQSPVATIYIVLSAFVNGVRFFLTMSMAAMREEEERSGYTPFRLIEYPDDQKGFDRLRTWWEQRNRAYLWMTPADRVLGVLQKIVFLFLTASLFELALTPLILPN